MFHVDPVFSVSCSALHPLFFFTPYSHCFCWLSLSLCDYFVAKLEPAVHVSSCVQAPSLAAQHTQSFPQVPLPSSLPLGLLAGICNRVACQSVRLGILKISSSSPSFISIRCCINNIQPSIHPKMIIRMIEDVPITNAWIRFDLIKPFLMNPIQWQL